MSKLKIINKVKVENKLLDRDEYLISFKNDGATKSKVEIVEFVEKEFKVKKELLIINKVKTSFGINNFEVDFYIYKNAEVLAKLTPKHISKRCEKYNKKEEVVEEKVEKKVEETNSDEKVKTEEATA